MLAARADPIPPARRNVGELVAASSVLRRSIAIVIGPTPPGTGVIAPASSAAGSKSTSPTRPSSVRLMPTSMTVAPGLTQSPWTIRGEPTAAIEDVRRAADGAEVAGARVADGDGRAGVGEKRRHRAADEDRAADDDRVRAAHLDPGLAQQLHDRRAACTAPCRAGPGRGARRWWRSGRRRPWRDRSRRPPRPGRERPAAASGRGSRRPRRRRSELRDEIEQLAPGRRRRRGRGGSSGCPPPRRP